MISKYVMIALIVFYIVLAGLTMLEGKTALMSYWIGAIILNLAVMEMAY